MSLTLSVHRQQTQTQVKGLGHVAPSSRNRQMSTADENSTPPNIHQQETQAQIKFLERAAPSSRKRRMSTTDDNSTAQNPHPNKVTRNV